MSDRLIEIDADRLAGMAQVVDAARHLMLAVGAGCDTRAAMAELLEATARHLGLPVTTPERRLN